MLLPARTSHQEERAKGIRSERQGHTPHHTTLGSSSGLEFVRRTTTDRPTTGRTESTVLF
jgi:hypothetical protein